MNHLSFKLQKWSLLILALCLSLFLVNCNNGDDEDEVPKVVTASDFTASITEKLEAGTVIGNVTASVPQGETATYALVSSNPNGALALSATGELTIGDAAAFDFDVRQSITGTFRATAANISDEGTITVNLEDDGIVAPEDQRQTDGYVIVTATPGGQSYFAQYYAEVPSGTLDNSSGTDFTRFFPRDIFQGSIYFEDPNESNNFVRMSVDGNEDFVIDGSIPFIGDNSFAMIIKDETTGVLHDRNEPTRLTIFDPIKMSVEATIDMSAGELPTDTLSQRYQNFFFRGNEVYSGVRPTNGGTYSSALYHVADVSTGRYLRTVVAAEESLFYDFLLGGNPVADDGTLYLPLIGNVNVLPATQARILRILPGQNEVDTTYDFRPAQVINPANVFLPLHNQFRYIGDKKAIALVASSIPQEVVDIVIAAGGVPNLSPDQINQVLQILFTQPTANWCVLDLEAQTVTPIPGLPQISYFAGVVATLDGDNVYLPVLTDQVNEVYRYSISSGMAEKAFEVSGGGGIYAVYSLGNDK
ncbi:MAG: cadherin repeat domain-containing protein [Bacteroidota bacterium]